jgi:hypothetical protein
MVAFWKRPARKAFLWSIFPEPLFIQFVTFSPAESIAQQLKAGFRLGWFPADLCSFMPIRAVRSDFIGFALGEPE